MKVLLGGATLVGAYVGARAINLEWVLATLALVAGVWAFGPDAYRGTADIMIRIRQYQRILELLGQSQEDVRTLQSWAQAAEDRVQEAFEQGLREGSQQAWSAAFGAALPEPAPVIVAVVMRDDGVRLVATWDNGGRRILVRFCAEIEATGDIVGSAEIEEFDDERDQVVLRVVERHNRDFWERMESKATGDPSPPPGLILTPYRSPAPEDVMHGRPRRLRTPIERGRE